VGGKPLAGWLVTGLDATLIIARSEKEGAAGSGDPTRCSTSRNVHC